MQIQPSERDHVRPRGSDRDSVRGWGHVEAGQHSRFSGNSNCLGDGEVVVDAATHNIYLSPICHERECVSDGLAWRRAGAWKTVRTIKRNVDDVARRQGLCGTGAEKECQYCDFLAHALLLDYFFR